jgi:hypothetical protein
LLFPLLAEIYSIISSFKDLEDEAKFYFMSYLIDSLIPELLIDSLIDYLIDSLIILDSAAIDYFIADS